MPLEDRIHQQVDLEHALHEADEIGAALLDGPVRRVRPVDRQNDKEPAAAACGGLQCEAFRGGKLIGIAGPLERVLAHSAVAQVEAVDRLGILLARVGHREVFVLLGSDADLSIGADAADAVVGDAALHRLLFMRSSLLARHARNPCRAENGGLVLQKAIGKDLEFGPGDLVRRLEQGPQRDDLGKVFVQSRLQCRGDVVGSADEREFGNLAFPMGDNERCTDRKGQAGDRHGQRAPQACAAVAPGRGGRFGGLAERGLEAAVAHQLRNLCAHPL